MTSFGTFEDMIDFQIRHPKDFDRLVSGSVLVGPTKHIITDRDILLSIGGGSSSGGSSHPGYGDGSGPPPDIADTNWEQRLRDFKDSANKKIQDTVDRAPEIATKEAILEAFSQTIEMVVKHGPKIAKYSTLIGGVISGMFDWDTISTDQDGYPLVSSTAVLADKNGRRIGRLVVSRDAQKGVRFTIYSTNPNPKGSFFKSTDDGAKVQSIISELTAHAEHDTSTTNTGRDPSEVPSAGEVSVESKESAKETLQDNNLNVENADQNEGDDNSGDETPVVRPLG